jgi:hypothetical protein
MGVGRGVSLTKHDSQTRVPFFNVKSMTRRGQSPRRIFRRIRAEVHPYRRHFRGKPWGSVNVTVLSS